MRLSQFCLVLKHRKISMSVRDFEIPLELCRLLRLGTLFTVTRIIVNKIYDKKRRER